MGSVIHSPLSAFTFQSPRGLVVNFAGIIYNRVLLFEAKEMQISSYSERGSLPITPTTVPLIISFSSVSSENVSYMTG